MDGWGPGARGAEGAAGGTMPEPRGAGWLSTAEAA